MGPFRDSQAPSCLSGPRTDVLNPPSHGPCFFDHGWLHSLFKAQHWEALRLFCCVGIKLTWCHYERNNFVIIIILKIYTVYRSIAWGRWLRILVCLLTHCYKRKNKWVHNKKNVLFFLQHTDMFRKINNIMMYNLIT